MTPAPPQTEYAFWKAPETGFTVTYSLGAFHEIDYEVNEGYRRIPHGGIEVGGLLFGRSDANSATIEAFRMIHCEHASGPSFILSEHDRERLREQIAVAGKDPDLHDLQLLGWFIAHTRTPLKMNDREAVLFDEFFPEPGKLMMLVKPERFQPTQFGFLVRHPDKSMPRDATQQAIILPLPGRASRSDGAPVASIPAPADRVPAAAPISPSAPSPAVPESPPRTPAAKRGEITDLVPYDRENGARSATQLSSLPSIEEIRRRRSEYFEGPLQITGEVQPPSLRTNLRLTLVLFLAAAIGCGVGYWAYLQLPSATVPLYVQAQPAALLVSWPPEQTRDCVFAALRINDEQEVPLSLMQRDAGQATLPFAADNIKIELIAQHWMRDSRGIIRYVKPLPPPVQRLAAPPAETQ